MAGPAAAPAATPAAAPIATNGVNPGNTAAPFQTSTIGYGMNPSGGPSFTGTGLFEAQPYAINDQAITGNPVQGAAQDYGLNDVWSNLASALQANQVNNYAAQAPTAQAAQANYALAGPTQISTAGDAQFQNQQEALANTLNTQATGGGVSPADLQLAQGAQQNLAGQLSALGSQRGGASGDPALAARMAADAGASAGANLNSQMGIQRAQETLNAQNAEGSVLGTARGQAQTYNTAQAGLTQAQQLANAQNAQATQIANLGANQQTNLANQSTSAAQTLANQQAAITAQNQYNQQLNALLGAQTGVGESQQAAALANQQLQVQQQNAVNQVNEAAYGNAAQANANLTGALAATGGALGATALNAFKGTSSPTASSPDATPSGSAAATYNPNQPSGFDPGADTTPAAPAVDTSGGTDLWNTADNLSSQAPDVTSASTLDAQNFYGTSAPASQPTGGPVSASSAIAANQQLFPGSSPAPASAPTQGQSANWNLGPGSTQSSQFPGVPYPSGNAVQPNPFAAYGQPMPGVGASPMFGGGAAAGGYAPSQQTATGGYTAPVTDAGLMGPGSYVNQFGVFTNAASGAPMTSGTTPVGNILQNQATQTAIAQQPIAQPQPAPIQSTGVTPVSNILDNQATQTAIATAPQPPPQTPATPVSNILTNQAVQAAQAVAPQPPPQAAPTAASNQVANMVAQNAAAFVPGGAPAATATSSTPKLLTTGLRYSDENAKTGIEGGNPMLQSFLSQYRQFKAPMESVNVTSNYQGPRAGMRGPSTTTGNAPTAGAPILGRRGNRPRLPFRSRPPRRRTWERSGKGPRFGEHRHSHDSGTDGGQLARFRLSANQCYARADSALWNDIR